MNSEIYSSSTPENTSAVQEEEIVKARVRLFPHVLVALAFIVSAYSISVSNVPDAVIILVIVLSVAAPIACGVELFKRKRRISTVIMFIISAPWGAYLLWNLPEIVVGMLVT